MGTEVKERLCEDHSLCSVNSRAVAHLIQKLKVSCLSVGIVIRSVVTSHLNLCKLSLCVIMVTNKNVMLVFVL